MPPSVLIRVGQQRQEARTLHGYSELPLIERLRARDAARNDLARLGDVTLESGQILVVDVLHALGREAAELLATGEPAVAAALAAAAATAAVTVCHVCSPQPSPAGAPSSSEALSSRAARSRRGGRSPPSSSSERRRRSPPSSSSAFAIGEGSVTASFMETTRWRSTASLNRNAPVSSLIAF